MQNFDPMSLLLSDALTAAFWWANDLIDQVVGNSRKVESKIQKRPEQALQRELQEEISLPPDRYRVSDRRGPYRYLFPPGRKKEGFDGQEQTYFLVDLLPTHFEPSPHTPDPEFRAIRWIWPHEFEIAWIPSFKREVYRQVMCDIFQLRL